MSQGAASTVERFVLVIGETGVGKSTVTNMLFNHESTVDCCQTPCCTGSSAASVTKHSSLFYDFRNQWALIDTVGIGDPEMKEADILGAIRTLVRDTSRGVHSVIVVMKMERVPLASRANLALLQKLFRDEDLRRQAMLVLTHWTGELGEEKQDLDMWVGTDEQMKLVVDSFAQVVLTNNQLTGRGAYPECRQRCLDDMSNFIQSAEGKICAKRVNYKEVFIDIMRDFGAMLWGSAVSLKDLLRTRGNSLPTYCGECAVCHEHIPLEDLSQLQCQHSFHSMCIQGLNDCPLCRTAIGNVFSLASFV